MLVLLALCTMGALLVGFSVTQHVYSKILANQSQTHREELAEAKLNAFRDGRRSAFAVNDGRFFFDDLVQGIQML